jgi:hypothetical protein
VLLQQHTSHILGTVGDAADGIVREVAALPDEKVLQSGELGIQPDLRIRRRTTLQ